MGDEEAGALKEIGRARALHNNHGGTLALVNGTLDLLDAYRRAIRETGEVMERLKVTDACSHCAAAEAGSCCFEGVEGWYDDILLYINLAMGADLPESREVPGGCLFVGSKGCKLVARHAFCINYLCPHLHHSLTRSQRALFLSTAGDELKLGWEIEKEIRRRLIAARPMSPRDTEKTPHPRASSKS